MKKAISILLSVLLIVLCAVPAFAEPEQTFGGYEHVFIVGVDGAGRFFREVDTPNFDRIFADGAVDYTARTETVTVSAQNWGSILKGVSYLRHLHTNPSIANIEHDSSTRYPSIFTYARRAFPDAELSSYVHWGPINHGIIETDINVNKVSIGDDAELTDVICDYFNGGASPKLFFCHFDGVDEAGHDKGSNAAEYREQIMAVDGYIGRIYDALEANGLMENGLFIVVSDHGHMTIGGHFGWTARETNTTLAVKGKTVIPGAAMDGDTRRFCHRAVCARHRTPRLYVLPRARQSVPGRGRGEAEHQVRPDRRHHGALHLDLHDPHTMDLIPAFRR